MGAARYNRALLWWQRLGDENATPFIRTCSLSSRHQTAFLWYENINSSNLLMMTTSRVVECVGEWLHGEDTWLDPSIARRDEENTMESRVWRNGRHSLRQDST